MQERLLVMNGQRIVQAKEGGEWTNQKVDKAGALKPGIYNLYLAGQADKGKRYDGVMVHSDDKSVYQKVGKQFVMHSKKDFDIVPKIGEEKGVSYGPEGRAVVEQANLQKKVQRR